MCNLTRRKCSAFQLNKNLYSFTLCLRSRVYFMRYKIVLHCLASHFSFLSFLSKSWVKMFYNLLLRFHDSNLPSHFHAHVIYGLFFFLSVFHEWESLTNDHHRSVARAHRLHEFYAKSKWREKKKMPFLVACNENR